MKKLPFILLLIMVLSCKEESETPNEELNLSSSATATDKDGNIYEVGFEQASSINQNPFVRKTDESGNTLWKVNYEKSAVDGRAVLVAIDDNNNVWVTFTVDGGSNEDTNITKHAVANDAFQNVYANSYGSGGGPKASLLAKINPDNGKMEKATFLTARLSSGKTNTLQIEKIGFSATGILLEVKSAAWPPGVGKKYSRYPDITDEDRIDNAFFVTYEIAFDLSEIITAKIK